LRSTLSADRPLPKTEKRSKSAPKKKSPHSDKRWQAQRFITNQLLYP
jgi:hypothetical protein